MDEAIRGFCRRHPPQAENPSLSARYLYKLIVSIIKSKKCNFLLDISGIGSKTSLRVKFHIHIQVYISRVVLTKSLRQSKIHSMDNFLTLVNRSIPHYKLILKGRPIAFRKYS